MTRTAKKPPRCAKAARRAFKQIAAKGNRCRRQQTDSVGAQEAENERQRLSRREETETRNAAAQRLPRNKRRKKYKNTDSSSLEEILEFDRQAFFDCIDEPLVRVCGSCGELANSANAVLKLFDPDSVFFNPLRNEDGNVDIIEAGLMLPSDTIEDSTKFSRASGFRLGKVPEELAALNRIEARLVGLGISFTTCVNLYRDGQEFTRGNAINYWNEPGEVVRELPRPLKSCGVVVLAAKSDKATNYFRVRPYLVRRALCWLIHNNPLYANISISEQNLQALEDLNIDEEIPHIPVTDDEVQELQGHGQHLNSVNANAENNIPNAETNGLDSNTAKDANVQETRESTTYSTESDREEVGDLIHGANENRQSLASVHTSSIEQDQTCNACPCTAILPNTVGTINALSLEGGGSTVGENVKDSQDIMDNLTESFELEGNHNSKKSELEHILRAAGVDATHSKIPVGELRCQQDPINEYQTKQLMQCCFPTLFPDGMGGFYPLDSKEDRAHEYKLSEFCAHLMKYHDRRFVIHGNFKFFCMNLIQRRQIDGLVRRVFVTESRTEAINIAGSRRNQNAESENGTSGDEKKELNAAIQVLESLKPFFRVVRGSGLYGANARDDLMTMIGNRVMPTRWPTFFLTLSAADTIWPDFARACDPSLTMDECRKLSYSERRKLLNENPDISARHFNRRFQSFFDNILCGKGKPLGEIIDHLWRVEFQQRGSPHIHCLLWIKDAPDGLQLAETEEGRSKLAAYVDKHISVLSKTLKELNSCLCSTCCEHRDTEVDILALRPPSIETEQWKCDLSRLVQRVQQHVCNDNSSCRKKGNECRFGFPKRLETKTNIETSVSSDGTPSLKVNLKRDVSTINNYSPQLLSCWRANMDLQLIGNSYGYTSI